MKINKKVISLLEGGFSMQTLRGMSDNNINYLYTKLMKEQTTQTKGSIATKNEPKAMQLAAKGYNVRLEKKEMGEANKKSQAKNPFAICTAQLKKEFGTSERSEWTKPQLKKYERCVMDVKKGVKEGVNPIDAFIENEMDRMIESYSQPKVTKSALLRHLKEQPTTKPVVKPAKPTTKPTRRDNPFINPNPKVNPDPKAISPEKAKNAIINNIMQLLNFEN